jgi:PAS domain S-box-containing protein
MSAPLMIGTWSGWTGLGSLAVPKLTTPECVALVMLAASILVYRTFRERYLLTWILGWLAYFLSSWTVRDATIVQKFPPELIAISQVEFVLAICLFAAAVFTYTHGRKLMVPLLAIAVSVMGFTAARVLLWPDSLTLRVALEVSYRIVTFTAAIQMIRYRWGRWEIGPWLVSACLILLHLEQGPVTHYWPAWASAVTDLFFGLGMIFTVFDESKARTRRLAVVNSLSTTITRAQQHGPMMQTALEELKSLMGARAAWFRLLEGQRMVIAQHVGVSQEFLRSVGQIGIDERLQQVLQQGTPMVVKSSAVEAPLGPQLAQEKIRQVVLIPLLGKKSMIGTLALGWNHTRSLLAEDIDFLSTTTNQLGLAVENLRLLEQILRSQRQWMNTFDSIQDLILAHDADFRVIKVNQALLQRLNRAPADVVGKTCEEILPKKPSEWTNCPYCARGDSDFAEGADPCFGGYSMVSTSSYTEQGTQKRGTIHVVRDTSDRRAAEEKFRLIFEQVQEGVFVATPDGKLLDCNDAFVKLLGYDTREELMSIDIDEKLYASMDERDHFRREIEQHNYVRNFEVTMRKKDGSLLTAAESSFATRDSNGRIDRYQGFLLDMTSKRRAEDEMRRRNRELNALNAMAVIATQSFDLDEILNLTLRQVVSLFGAETGSIYLSDADATLFRRRAGWGQRSENRARFAEVILTEGFGDLVMRSRTEVITQEFVPHLPPLVAEFLRADGLPSWIWVLLWSKDKPIGVMGVSCRESREYTSNDENLMVAIGRQLATTIEKVRLYEETCRAYEDLRKTQEQLLQSEKMSAVGQLISGVAHELNNPLTAILGYAQLLENEGLNERASDFVRKLFKQAQRTHRVVQNLLSFARQRKPQKQEVDVARVLEETLALRDYDLKVNNIAVERKIEPGLPTVTADPHQLEQVFLNIINNAVDAILEKETRGTMTVVVAKNEEYVSASFCDSGPGIKDPKRIFDPFYTTKNVGKGTGLGLSICYGIVKEHGGDILAQNREEGGAQIEVRLPISGQKPATDEPSVVSRREFALEGRMLLVEDEEAVLEFERDVLVGAGAQVVTAMSADEARSKIRSEMFDALVVNGRMPGGWNAPDVYKWVKETCPGLEKKLLFTFSTLADPEIRAFMTENNLVSLVKPFEVADLIAHARTLLQRVQSAAAGR